MKDTASARLTRASGTNFYYAFRVLPELQRRAIFALYSFCRVVDDCVDEPGGEGEAGLRRWMEEVRRCYAGNPETELGRDLAEAVARFPIPRACFEDIVEGCRMDLAIRRYPTFADLRVYCERVASAVGLASIEIFGYTNPQTRRYAVELGVALQLTNILRDVGADAARGRLYIPLDELHHFRVEEEQIFRAAGGEHNAQLRLLLGYQAERAREHFKQAQALLPPEDRRSMLSAEMMSAVYREILDELVRRGFPIAGPRLRLSTARKAWIALRALFPLAPAGVKVVVVGGGFAGLAAAIALQERRHDVTLLERRGVLGGRATSFPDAVSGEDVDNGTHLMIGAYRDTLDLVRRAGAEDLLLVQERLHIDYRDDRGWSTLDCPALPAPLHLLAGLAGLRMPWRARLDAVRLGLAARFGGPPAGLTLTEWFDRLKQGADVRRLLWAPLATAILNETPDRAAAILFYNVYRAAFLESAAASRLVFLRRGYGRLLNRLGAYLEARGGRIVRRARAETIEVEGGAVTGVAYAQRPTERDDIVRGVQAHGARIDADAVVSAVPWSALPALLPEGWRADPAFAAASRLTGSPIVSIEMWLDQVVVDRAMAGLRDCEVEWVFDKGRLYGREGPPQHLAFIISAAYRSTPRPNAELVGMAEAALRRYFPAMAGARVTRTLVLREADATFSCDPASEAIRPGPATPIRGLVLAGDWTATALPATIEGAVRSGRAAARQLEA